MNAKPALTASDRSARCIEQTPVPMATVQGAGHILSYANPAFCQLAHTAEEDLLGRPLREILGDERVECLALLTRVHRTGKPETYTEHELAHPGPVFWSYTGWPMIADEPTLGVMIQMVESAPPYQQTVAMNEALVIGSLRQHELTAVATLSNTRLQAEVAERKQREHDAQMLTHEISHRIKNNLHIVAALIRYEAKHAAASGVPGYQAIQTRIVAIAALYDLISQSGRGQTIALDTYLREIAKAMSASLLGTLPGIKINVEAEALNIDANRAVPFGLLINELTTNAIRHAFPGGTGSVALSLRQTGDHVELDVADDGIGIKDAESTKTAERHGSDYVAIFVRQLGGTLDLLGAEGTGTIARITFPSRVEI